MIYVTILRWFSLWLCLWLSGARPLLGLEPHDVKQLAPARHAHFAEV